MKISEKVVKPFSKRTRKIVIQNSSENYVKVTSDKPTFHLGHQERLQEWAEGPEDQRSTVTYGQKVKK